MYVSAAPRVSLRRSVAAVLVTAPAPHFCELDPLLLLAALCLPGLRPASAARPTPPQTWRPPSKLWGEGQRQRTTQQQHAVADVRPSRGQQQQQHGQWGAEVIILDDDGHDAQAEQQQQPRRPPVQQLGTSGRAADLHQATGPSSGTSSFSQQVSQGRSSGGQWTHGWGLLQPLSAAAGP